MPPGLEIKLLLTSYAEVMFTRMTKLDSAGEFIFEGVPQGSAVVSATFHQEDGIEVDLEERVEVLAGLETVTLRPQPYP